ncbi:hypothetical protein P7C70_g160, partial [Phenoliferia sp. Uapishka_3]
MGRCTTSLSLSKQLSLSSSTFNIESMLSLSAIAILCLAGAPEVLAAPATFPNANTPPPADVNMTMSVESCSSRMNGKLPPFIPTGFNYSGTTRRYYVKAEEVEWDYIPSGENMTQLPGNLSPSSADTLLRTGWDNMRGVPVDESPVADGSDYIPSNTSIGHKYIKGLFRGYTSSNYSTLSSQPDWLGFQGPLMRGEVGDMVEVMLYNDLQIATHPVSMHSMGLHYSPKSEGSMYYRGVDANGTAVSYSGDAIQPGECFVYKWLIPESSAPDAGLPSKLWSYHGDVNLLNDVMAGFFGPFIAYNRGQMESVMAKYAKEFVMYFSTSVESQSYYLNDNVAKYLPDQTFDAQSGAPVPVPTSSQNETVWGNIYNDLPPIGSNATLAQSFMTINGFAYANMPTLQMCQDDDVIWHIWSMGSFNDGYHSAHGNNVQTASGANMAQLSLLPASMTSVVMSAANVGLWQFLCHVAAHWQMGMQVNYNITTSGTSESCPAKAASNVTSASLTTSIIG